MDKVTIREMNKWMEHNFLVQKICQVTVSLCRQDMSKEFYYLMLDIQLICHLKKANEMVCLTQ